MSENKDYEILTLLQPELLPDDRLISYLKSRCTNIQNLSSLSKERLVKLFRQVILPLPQRQCWVNRRGKALTPRRLKSSTEGRHDDTSSLSGSATGTKRLSTGEDRLTDTGPKNKVRITASSRDSDLDKIVINDRRKNSDGRKGGESLSPGKVEFKRSSGIEKCSTESSSREQAKKQRTAIKWP